MRAGKVALGVAALALGLITTPLALASSSKGADPGELSAGLKLLLHEPLSIGVFSEEELERLWTVWEPGEKAEAESATSAERQQLTFERYGLIERPSAASKDSSSEDRWLPLGYTREASGRLAPNCLVCHGGKVAGQVIPGLPNSHQDFSGLMGDLAVLRAVESGRDPEAARKGASFGVPLNFVKGSTNATMFSVLLGSMRDRNIDMQFPPKLVQPLVHNSIDAPPWWHFKRKSRIYWDGMAPKSVRTLMQFTMAPGLSGEKIRSWEDEFVLIRDFINSVEPPKYPFAIDQELAEKGRLPFERVCSECHGTYGPENGKDPDQRTYPERTIALALLGTDPVRLDAIRPESKEKYNDSWFSNYGEHPVILKPKGYVAPPLDGIWASAPYLHNGSVPTLWHMLFPDQRPSVWQRTEDGYDQQRVGLEVTQFHSVPEGISDRKRRTYFDTALVSHSAQGHVFPEKLSVADRALVLEYLKTL